MSRGPANRWRAAWRDVQWLVLGALAILAVVLGTIGYVRAGESFWDSLYQSLQLFSLNAEPQDDVRTTLQIARFLAPAVAGFAAAAALIALFRDQIQRLGVRLFAHGHTVVVGLGTKGMLLVDQADGQVVVVERDAKPAVDGQRSRGTPVILGDATDPEVLRKARVGRAARVIVACGDDEANLDALVALREAVDSDGAPEALVHLRDMDLWRLMEAEILRRLDPLWRRTHFFSVSDLAARLLLEEHPPFTAGSPSSERPHVLLVGFDGIGESLLLHLAGLWRRQQRDNDPLAITLVDPAATERQMALFGRYPELARILAPTVRDVDVGSASFRGAEVLGRESSVVYITVEPARKGLAAALRLRSAGVGKASMVVAVDNEDGGVGSAIRTGRELMPNVHAFGVLSRTLTPEFVALGSHEIIARAMHESFRRQGLADARGDKVTMRPWSELPESYKDENRSFADGVAPKLAAVGCALVPNPLADSNGFAFSAAEIERLAPMEHARWCETKEKAGWRYGPVHDEEQKVHPSLVPWADLTETDRDKDRNAVAALPGMLALAGFEIYRI